MTGEAVAAALAAAGLALGEAEEGRLAVYVERVLAANAVQNLTALRSPDLFASLGVVDSLLAARELGLSGEDVVDVGSGNGLPAVPWALVGLAGGLRLVEAERRKAEFLRSTCTGLGVAAEVEWARAEELARGRLWDQADVVTARALAPAAIALEIAGGLVRRGGRLALLKGPRGYEEARLGAPVAKRMGFSAVEVRAYPLPGGEKRTLLVYRKEFDTPAGHPISFARLRKEFPARRAYREREGAPEGE